MQIKYFTGGLISGLIIGSTYTYFITNMYINRNNIIIPKELYIKNECIDTKKIKYKI